MNYVEPMLISTAETARILSVSRPKVYQLMGQDGFPVVRLGGRTLISVDGLRDWIKQQTEAGK